MNTLLIELIGFVAGGLVSTSFLPQVVKSWKSKQVTDLSLSLTLMNICGQLTWIFYGILQNSISIIIMSIITLIFTSILMYLKLNYSKY